MMGLVKQGKWRCRICYPKNRASNTVTVVEGSQLEQSAILIEVAKISKKLELIFPLKVSVDQLLQLPAKVDGFLCRKPTVLCIKDTVDAMQESSVFLG